MLFLRLREGKMYSTRTLHQWFDIVELIGYSMVVGVGLIGVSSQEEIRYGNTSCDQFSTVDHWEGRKDGGILGRGLSGIVCC